MRILIRWGGLFPRAGSIFCRLTFTVSSARFSSPTENSVENLSFARQWRFYAYSLDMYDVSLDTNVTTQPACELWREKSIKTRFLNEIEGRRHTEVDRGYTMDRHKTDTRRKWIDTKANSTYRILRLADRCCPQKTLIFSSHPCFPLFV